MLAARDQENLVHSHQTTAAAKPMNQTVRALQSKTPGNKPPKTPFKVALDDENNPAAFGKRTIKPGNLQDENVMRLGKDGDKNAFVTPMGPRNRAPLGMKTTNAKAKAFQTPAPQPHTTKPLKTGKRPSTVRKVKQALPELQENIAQDVKIKDPEEERDVEYAPPKPKELPDVPDDYITYNTDFPQFKGANFSRGWAKLYDDNPVGEDGLTRREREMKQHGEEYYKKMDEAILKQVENMDIREEFDEPFANDISGKITKGGEEAEKRKRTTDRPVSTMRSREAAKALSQQPPTAMLQSKPRATVAPRPTSRLTSALTGPKKQPTPSNPSSMRHTAATVGSRTTLGYSKGRSVSSTLREKSANRTVTNLPNRKPAAPSSKSNSILSPEKYMEMYGPPPFGTEMWSRCKDAGCFDAGKNIVDDDAEILEEFGASKPYEEDEETANFQLTL